MITKEQFLKSLNVARKRSEFIDKLYDLHIDILECQDGFDEMYSLFTELAFTEEGNEWYYWYLYEVPGFSKHEPHAWDENGDPIILNNDEDLWDFFIKNKYLR